jgi:hypothetical protein
MNEAELPDVGRFYGALFSLERFDNAEVLPKVKDLAAPTERQHCFIAGYYRATTTVRSLLRLNNPSHFQAVSGLARTLLELAVDLRLIDVTPEAVPKIYAFARLERLRSAEKMIAFGRGLGASDDLSVYHSFVASNKESIEATCRDLWPNVKLRNLKHWTLLSFQQQAERLGEPFAEMYHVNYKPLSWQVHSGLAGVIDLEKQAFAMMCGVALKIALDCYAEVLRTTISEFSFARADGKILKKLELATLLPFTDDQAEAAALERAMLS